MRRVVLVTAASVAVAAAAVVVPLVALGAPGHHASPGRNDLVAAQGTGDACPSRPVPAAPADPDVTVPREVWSTSPEITPTLWTVPGREVESASVQSSATSCRSLPIAVLFSTVPQRGIAIYRDVHEALARVPADQLEDVTVRGRPGQVLTPPAGLHHLVWADAAGVEWYAEASGVTVDELIDVLDEALDDDGLASTPDGFSVAEMPPPGAATLFRTTVTYADGSILAVTSPTGAPVELSLADAVGREELTTVGDKSAVFTPEHQSGAKLSWATEKASFALFVPGASLDDLRGLAASLVPIAPDDPLIAPIVP
jgi:hypothetical protein